MSNTPTMKILVEVNGYDGRIFVDPARIIAIIERVGAHSDKVSCLIHIDTGAFAVPYSAAELIPILYPEGIYGEGSHG